MTNTRLNFLVMRVLILFYLGLLSVNYGFGQQRVTVKVIDSENSEPIGNATIRITKQEVIGRSGADGIFRFDNEFDSDTLKISSVNYVGKSVTVRRSDTILTVELVNKDHLIDEVQIVYTGLQALPKERATGSFVSVDKELLNRRVGTDFASRLEDVTPGLVFNRNGVIGSPFNIRGQSGIFSNTVPLVVVDNFVYDGDLSNINPNDIENITILKDAAAASIWGARAGNGVIVVTTKLGRQNQKPIVELNSSFTIGELPDVYYLPRMSATDFIDVEKMLFNKGFYNSIESSPNKTPLTPVIELLIAHRDGNISEQERDAAISNLQDHDLRDDLRRYVYRNGTKQQYALNLTGGAAAHQYFYSVGYDRDSKNLLSNEFSRFTFNGKNKFHFFNNKLEVTSNFYLSKTRTDRERDLSITSDLGLSASSLRSMYPYIRLADSDGTALTVNRGYRNNFLEDAEKTGLLDWRYRPLDELRNADNYTRGSEYRLNTQLRYNFTDNLNFDVLYQFARTTSEHHNRQGLDTYFTRDLINRFAQPRADGSIDYPVPTGDILNKNFAGINSHAVRGQLNYALTAGVHDFSGLAGYELKDFTSLSNRYRVYGYDPERVTMERVDYTSSFSQYHNPNIRSTIPYGNSATHLNDRFVSYFGNAAYTFDHRYTLSLSTRFDQSNLFGVRTNQKGVPLWSVGAMWTIDQEKFYSNESLQKLRFRATYGYNGNLDKSLSAYTTAIMLGSGADIPEPFATILNPPNPDLRWERIRTINVGIDFATQENRLAGSIEFYSKKGSDIIGDRTMKPSTGVFRFRGNYASTSTKGVDLSLHSANIQGQFGWSTDLILSWIKDRVLTYDVESTSLSYVMNGDNGQLPFVGKPLYGTYSYSWAGLDPSTGDPQGYLGGEISKEYAQIISNTLPDGLIFHGSARPTWIGALRNTFQYKNFTLSTNISFRLGYYYRRPGIAFNSILSGNGYTSGADYPLRWKQTGDEKHTQVPSMPTATNTARDNVYRYSSVLVEPGDHIRLQDIKLEYALAENHSLSGLSNLRIYVYIDHLGLLWKRSPERFDPDYLHSMPAVRTYSLGVTFNLK